jgi:hypothetical protein
MTNDSTAEEGRLSKFSNADRDAYWRPLPGTRPEAPLPARPEINAPLAEMAAHVIRDGMLHEEILPNKLVQELRSAQEQIWAEQPPEYRLEQGTKAALDAPSASGGHANPELLRSPGMVAVRSSLGGKSRGVVPRSARFVYHGIRSIAGGSTAQRVSRLIRASGPAGVRMAKACFGATARVARRMRFRDWRRRYLALLSLVHRHVFDRRSEQLLFSKTPPLLVYQVTETETGPLKTFIYEGPIPRKVLNWALSALPSDLKRYAFVDFRAGHGRTLLLAARRNFEYAAGYAFDSERCDELELNLAQYPRSYLGCRDLRAVRGDRNGVVIPQQPAVLFFPDNLIASHLDIILSYVSASYRLNPRPLYLIFENTGRERGLDQMEIFEKVPLPILNRIKVFFFSPARVAVYRSVAGQGIDEAA